MSTQSAVAPSSGTGPVPRERGDGAGRRLLRLLLTNRVVLLAVLLVVMLVWLFIESALGYTSAVYNFDYMAASLINLVPLTMLALAEMVVIITGGGGIDLSVGAVVSLVGMFFGYAYGEHGWPLAIAIIVSILLGGVLGSVNGFLVGRLGFSPLIATLATFYAYTSLALVVTNSRPISTPPIQNLYQLSRSVQIPLIGQYLPLFPLGILLFLAPTLLIVWWLVSKSAYGRRLYAVGTNDVAATWSGVDVAWTRLRAYAIAGAISGAVAVVTVSQFASARPDAGTSGSGMAMPAITMAVLGGVAVTGGIGGTLGTVLAALLIIWLNAGLLLLFPGNTGTQVQPFALGIILVCSSLLNVYSIRRYGGAR